MTRLILSIKILRFLFVANTDHETRRTLDVEKLNDLHLKLARYRDDAQNPTVLSKRLKCLPRAAYLSVTSLIYFLANASAVSTKMLRPS